MNTILKTCRNPLDIASGLDISPHQARGMLTDDLEPLMGWGRVAMQKFLVSRRHVDAHHWPREHAASLAQYRKLHDQGRVTMCQGRDGVFILQYAIPNAVIVPRSAYFSHREIY